MAWLKQSDAFDADNYSAPLIGIAAEMAAQHDSGFHCHQRGQLLFTERGAIQITLTDTLSVLPPTRVAWIPPQILHRAQMFEAVGYRSLYPDAQLSACLPPTCEIFGVSPLLREILFLFAGLPFDSDWTQPRLQHLLPVFLDELTLAGREDMQLPLPSDRRLKTLDPRILPPQLNELASRCGAGEKTITRIFRRETGMSYQQWRQQWRLIKSVELLAKKYRSSDIAQALGFASDSAFVSFFRKMTGKTPGEYMGK